MDTFDRRGFLKRAGAGSLASASLVAASRPASGHPSADPPTAQAPRRGVAFSLATVLHAGRFKTVDPGMLLSGDGVATGRAATGGGRFVQFDELATSPKPVLANGIWQAGRLVRLDIRGTYGGFAAGILEMTVVIQLQGQRRRLDGTLKVVSNIPAAGLLTGEAGGLTLAIQGTPFVVGGAAGPFVTSRRGGRGFFLRT